MKKFKHINEYENKKELKEFDDYAGFDPNILLDNKFDYIALVLKTHLYFEYLLNKIIELSVSVPKMISDKNFSSKVDFLEALGLSKSIVKKLRSFNSIRNKIVHNYKYQVSNRDIDDFCEGSSFKKTKTELSFPEYSKKRLDFIRCIHFTIGYLHATRNIRTVMPLMSFCFNNEGLLNKDIVFKNMKSRLAREYNKTVNNLKK